MCLKKVVFFVYLPSEDETSFVSSLLKSTILNNVFDCVFFDLSEKVGRWELMRRIAVVVKNEKPDLCCFVPCVRNGITLKDYEVKVLLERLGKSLFIYFTGCQLHTFISYLLRKTFFTNQRVLITDWRDYQMMSRYTSKKDIFVCPGVDGINITMGKFENKMIDILKLQFVFI